MNIIEITFHVILGMIAIWHGYIFSLFFAKNEKARSLAMANLFFKLGKNQSPNSLIQRANWLFNILSILPFLIAFMFVTMLITYIMLAKILAMPIGLICFLFSLGLQLAFDQFMNYEIKIESEYNFSDELVKIVIRRIMRSCELDAKVLFINKIIQKKRWIIRQEAINAFGILPTNIALSHLAAHKNSSDPRIAKLAKDRRDEVLAYQFVQFQDKISTLNHLMKQYKKLKSQTISRILDRTQISFKMEEIGIKIDQFVWRNYPIHGNPSCFHCQNCQCFAIKEKQIEWSWVCCPKCNKSHTLDFFKDGIIGTIGIGKTHKSNSKLIPLWNMASNKAEYAEINHLEIHGGQKIDYDWAVCAVIEKLQNNGGRIRGLKIQLINSPKMTLNTMRLLKQFALKNRATISRRIT